MEKQTHRVAIEAPKEKVWEVLWGDQTYLEWTSVFGEGSHVDTNWEKGSKILFLDNKGHGMVATIADKIPNEFMSFNHLGAIKNGIEDPDSPESKEWAGAFENYTLKGSDGKTELVVEIDIVDQMKDYFQTTWPKALEKVKTISEKN